jgi:hypothetical protein
LICSVAADVIHQSEIKLVLVNYSYLQYLLIQSVPLNTPLPKVPPQFRWY